MAIDSAAKRSSVQAYTFGLLRPPPDATIEEGDRAAIAWLYSGLDYGEAPVEPEHKSRITGGLQWA